MDPLEILGNPLGTKVAPLFHKSLTIELTVRTFHKDQASINLSERDIVTTTHGHHILSNSLLHSYLLPTHLPTYTPDFRPSDIVSFVSVPLKTH